jgi:hypothetical protein
MLRGPGGRCRDCSRAGPLTGEGLFAVIVRADNLAMSCDQPILADHATNVSVASDAVLVEVDRAG